MRKAASGQTIGSPAEILQGEAHKDLNMDVGPDLPGEAPIGIFNRALEQGGVAGGSRVVAGVRPARKQSVRSRGEGCLPQQTREVNMLYQGRRAGSALNVAT